MQVVHTKVVVSIVTRWGLSILFKKNFLLRFTCMWLCCASQILCANTFCCLVVCIFLTEAGVSWFIEILTDPLPQLCRMRAEGKKRKEAHIETMKRVTTNTSGHLVRRAAAHHWHAALGAEVSVAFGSRGHQARSHGNLPARKHLTACSCSTGMTGRTACPSVCVFLFALLDCKVACKPQMSWLVATLTPSVNYGTEGDKDRLEPFQTEPLL